MKNVLISGASRGIGFQLTKLFLKNGWNVYAVSRNTKPLSDLTSELDTKNLHVIQLDLTQDLDTLLDPEVSLDVLINNAGSLLNKPFLETSDADWSALLDVNVLGPAKLIRATIDNLKKAEHPHIVNISSMGGFQGSSKFPGLSAYSSSKGALAILTECLATELSEHKIYCNCLCLGAVNTEMLEAAFPGYTAPLQAEEMAQYIYSFSSGGHHYFNGQIIPVAMSNPG